MVAKTDFKKNYDENNLKKCIPNLPPCALPP